MSMLMSQWKLIQLIGTSKPAVPLHEKFAYHHVHSVNAAAIYVHASFMELLNSWEFIMKIDDLRMCQGRCSTDLRGLSAWRRKTQLICPPNAAAFSG